LRNLTVIQHRSRHSDGLRDELPGDGATRDVFGQRAHGLLEAIELFPLPGHAKSLHQDLALRVLQRRVHRVEQAVLLHPAARERIQRQHLTHKGITACEVLLPDGDVGSFLLQRLLGTQLVDEHDDRLVHPFQEPELTLDVSGGPGRLRGVHQVNDDVGFVLQVTQRLLRQVKGFVPPPVPHMGQEPRERIAGRVQALEQALAIAEARRIP
jgi:hypothetical protein